MGKRELIARELDYRPERDLDTLLGVVRSLRVARPEADLPMLAAESSLARDWLTEGEDEAWADL